MNLSHPFSQKTRDLWFPEHTWCGDCGVAYSKRPIELHHIYGRISSSVINSIPLCKLCHANVAIGKTDKEKKYVAYTLGWLESINYELTTKDRAFYNQTQGRTPPVSVPMAF
jgi:5-enolpyruvylshikimate-3-phosphate synthase